MIRKTTVKILISIIIMNGRKCCFWFITFSWHFSGTFNLVYPPLDWWKMIQSRAGSFDKWNRPRSKRIQFETLLTIIFILDENLELFFHFKSITRHPKNRIYSYDSYLPNKHVGPNKRVGWKIGQNQIVV